MKKNVRYVLAAVILLLLLVTAFGEPILDALPIDQSGWRKSGEVRYYRGEKGDVLTGWQEIEDQWYYLDPENQGAMATGWLQQADKRYYLTESGARAAGWTEVEGKTYFFESDGAMAVGWTEVNGERYFLNEEGNPQSGWLELDGKKYYLQDSGMMTTGWLELEGDRYYLGTDGVMATGWITVDAETYYLQPDGTAGSGWIDGRYVDEQGKLCVGWLELDGQRYYLDKDGTPHIGWLELEKDRYYLNEDGTVYTGWLELDGQRYYLQEDGTAAKGQLTIEETVCYFTSTGAQILLVNLWNPLPEGYWVPVVRAAGGAVVAEECVEDLNQMLSDCRDAGCYPVVCSSYRTIGTQQVLFNRRLSYWMSMGYSYDNAYQKARQEVAVPGTSEHHTGLAVDIVDSGYQLLTERQAEQPTQLWLMEHSWEYGFILRYPVGTTEQTGIVYEPWHYRYVGKELAKELYELDMCLEDYLDMLTEEAAE